MIHTCTDTTRNTTRSASVVRHASRTEAAASRRPRARGAAVPTARQVHALVIEHLQIRRQQTHVLVEVQDLLHEQAELPGQLQAVPIRHAHNLQQQPVDLRLIKRHRSGGGRSRTTRARPRPRRTLHEHHVERCVERLSLREDLLEVPGERLDVDLRVRGAHLHKSARGRVVVARRKGQQQRFHRAPDHGRHAPHDAEIDESHPAVPQREQVAGVHVRVERLRAEHAREPRVERIDERGLGVGHVPLERIQVGERDAVDELGGEHARRCRVLEDDWHLGDRAQPGGVEEALEFLDVAGLLV
mmetsp:Transcript_4930/g.19663  ORF Transcript_4930/g.19663 Transcript_4930/m.19663 type:complete len:301 (+) Transcript_4930:146-1048(+)